MEHALSSLLCRHWKCLPNPWLFLKQDGQFGHRTLLYVSGLANFGRSTFTALPRCMICFLKPKFVRVGCLLSKTLWFFGILCFPENEK